MRQIGQVIRLGIELLVPAALIAWLNYASRTGQFTLLNLSRSYAFQYGNYTLLLGVAAALVASATYNRDDRDFRLSAFLAAALANLVMIAPFVLGTTGIKLDVPPKVFELITIFAYLGFSITLGVIVGGCWSVLVKAVRALVFSRPMADDWLKGPARRK